MKATALRRLERLEKRRPKRPYGHLSDEEFSRYYDDFMVSAVEQIGIDEMRSLIEQGGPEAERLDALIAEGRIRRD